MLLVTLVAACDGTGAGGRGELTMENVKIWYMHGGDPSDQGFVFRQFTGFEHTMAVLNLSEEQVQHAFHIRPGDDVDTSIQEAIEWGADIIIGGTIGHGPHMLEAAQAHPEVIFLHATGNLALPSGLPNFHNFFGDMASARYLAGIAAGLKTETNVIGFVAAFLNSEVITGFTGFYLGAKSVNPDVTMLVGEIGSFNDPAKEEQIATSLANLGADVIGQHANSPTVQIAAEAAGVWGIGYNNDMIPFAPNATLVSPMFDWSVYFIHAISTIVAGGDLEIDYFGTLNDGMVTLSDFNTALIAPGTIEAIEEARARFVGGWRLFTGPLFAEDGTQLLADGEVFIEPQAAPSWNHIVQGITVVGS
jgi:basic membrane protein A